MEKSLDPIPAIPETFPRESTRVGRRGMSIVTTLLYGISFALPTLAVQSCSSTNNEPSEVTTTIVYGWETFLMVFQTAANIGSWTGGGEAILLLVFFGVLANVAYAAGWVAFILDRTNLAVWFGGVSAGSSLAIGVWTRFQSWLPGYYVWTISSIVLALSALFFARRKDRLAPIPAPVHGR